MVIGEVFTLDKLNDKIFRFGNNIYLHNITEEEKKGGGAFDILRIQCYPIEEIKESFREFYKPFVRAAAIDENCGSKHFLGIQIENTEKGNAWFEDFFKDCIIGEHLEYSIAEHNDEIGAFLKINCQLVIKMKNPTLVYNKEVKCISGFVPEFIEGRIDLFKCVNGDDVEYLYNLCYSFLVSQHNITKRLLNTIYGQSIMERYRKRKPSTDSTAKE